MKIMSFKPGHDGTVSVLDASAAELLYSYEAEKDSFARYSPVTPTSVLDAAGRLDDIPDVIAVSGWSKSEIAGGRSVAAGYYGIDREFGTCS
ncbi:hypothetical protein [Rhizobium gallicum]|uniref:hypothetical protein n=1 Tax=Rhizobium gallicum TaxID=56730 RepID=UPI001EF9AAC3|nr:hypothetical protein [Rhizobium gallicum]ULJ74276.1 hypothetical protein L2W42_22935 [Rhizobium gallicum]